MVILDGEATLYFFTNGLQMFSLTKISKIVLAKTLMIGAMGDGKKLAKENVEDVSPFVPLACGWKNLNDRLEFERVEFGDVCLYLRYVQLIRMPKLSIMTK